MCTLHTKFLRVGTELRRGPKHTAADFTRGPAEVHQTQKDNYAECIQTLHMIVINRMLFYKDYCGVTLLIAFAVGIYVWRKDDDIDFGFLTALRVTKLSLVLLGLMFMIKWIFS